MVGSSSTHSIREIFGKNLIDNDDAIRKVSISGIAEHSRLIKGIIYPESVESLRKCISDAYKNNIPVYPVSCGNNWGYGRSCPPVNDCIIINLKKLNKISNFDAELGSVEVEPGVTQGQLAKFLENTNWMMDCTGAGPDTSIIGNILERGFGHSPLGYRTRHFAVTKVVMANGDVCDLTTPGRFIGRVGFSAGLHELFTQNNIGVVVGIRLELVARQEESLRCIIKLNHKSSISKYIDAMRLLKAEQTITALPHIGNHYRMLGIFHQFDFDRKSSNSTFTEEELAELLKKYKLSAWMSSFAILGSSSVAKAKAKRIKRQLKGIAKVYIISYSTLNRINKITNWLAKHVKWLPKINTINSNVEDIYHAMGIFEGIPNNVALKGCYWRNKQSTPRTDIDPIENGCGFMWVAPSLPMLGADVEKFMDLTEQEFNKYNFELAVTLTAVTSMLCQAIISVYYDASSVEETQKAKKLVESLRELYSKNKWIPYRRAVDEMPLDQYHYETGAVWLRKIIKKSVDKNNIISPGRYEFKE
ncbi:FAD-dependent oxidoreductase [Zooshikella marina]|uniref:FAD-binding oxidoreductase n=1 Tax=Zooshikella ganghwensis TaxID=202772 RepID=UPI001BAE9985|nr:FAD-dependent oxidoreductase [Zooshikella ganghwensis]MBU2709109.1 FAD-dependent oxidoreductase [Zooshikella ganghwensis]